MNFSEFEFIPPTNLVFAHPLVKNVRSVRHLITEKQHDSLPERVNSSEKFFDPLGVAASALGGVMGTAACFENGKKHSNTTKVSVQQQHKKKFAGADELTSRFLNNTLSEEQEEEELDFDTNLMGFKPWRELKTQILYNFNTNDYLSLESSFLVISDVKADQIQEKQRALGENKFKFCKLTQEEYLKKLRDLKKILLYKWNQEKRIDCIKLITEVACLLSTTSVPQFYPQLFVHVTDFLDYFGNLVYERLLSKAIKERTSVGLTNLPKNFQIHDILEQTRMTARNWFGKISEIRELIPRIYIECTLLKCMSFMDQSAISANVMRLCSLVKSIQHPLTSFYARCYICRVSMRLDASDRAPGWKCLNDWMQTYTQQPTFLLWPAMQYIVQCVSYNAVTYNDLSPLWEYCRLPEKRAMILCPMLNGVASSYLAENALEACRIVTGLSGITGEEICALGANLLCANVPESTRKPILKSVWKCIMRLTSLKAYIQCCDVWIEFVVKYFTSNELQIVLESILRKLLPDKNYEYYFEYLLSIIKKILSHSNDLSELLSIDVFPQFIGIFREEKARLQSASLILNALILKHEVGAIKNFTLAYQVNEICKMLNDGISVLSPDIEINENTRLICLAMDRFDLKFDPEQALSYYVACRGSFLNNEQLQKYIVLRIMSLTIYVIRLIRFTTSRASFIQACIANLFITIPSLLNPIAKLRLSIQSAQVALAALAFLQVDEFIKFSLETFSELLLSQQSPQDIWSICAYFLSFLLIVPNYKEPLNVFSKFFKIIKCLEWPTGLVKTKARVLLKCMQYLLVTMQISNSSIFANNIQQFQWTRVGYDGQEHNDTSTFEKICRDKSNLFLVEIADILLNILRVGQMPMDDQLNISMELTEIIAEFAEQDLLPNEVRNLTKEAFQMCKRAGDKMSKRVKLLK